MTYLRLKQIKFQNKGDTLKFTSLYLSSIKSSVEYEETISTLMNIISSDRKVKIFVPIVKNMEIFQNAICDKQCAISYGILEDEAIELISCEKYSFVIEKIIKQFNALKDDCEFILCLGQKSCELNALVNKDIHLEITKHLQAIHVDIINCKDLSKIRIEQILNAKEIIYKQCGCLNIATLLLNANDAPNYRNIFCNKFDTNILSLIEENSTKELSITPIAFEFKLMQRARSQKKKIVLPESGDDRVLKAASILLEREVCDILLLGDNDYINQKEKELKLNLKKATILNPKTSPLHVEFTNAFYEMRKSKGMNLEKASELMNDLNYFGTMLIHTGLADGMVSGAIHTTADTIRPDRKSVV